MVKGSPNPLELLRAYCEEKADLQMLESFALLLQNPDHAIHRALRMVCKTSNDLVRRMLNIHPTAAIMAKHCEEEPLDEEADRTF